MIHVTYIPCLSVSGTLTIKRVKWWAHLMGGTPTTTQTRAKRDENEIKKRSAGEEKTMLNAQRV